MSEHKGLLSGFNILDLTHYVSGPYASLLMGSQGANVIKIERPVLGDYSRHIGPYPDNIKDIEKSGLFLYLNTSKKSITVNLKHESGREIFKRLVEWSDVLIENFAPRVMPSLQLSYDDLLAVNPELIMTSISNFGQSGPYRNYSAREINLYAIGGLMYITGDPDREPLQMGARLSQYGAGQNAFVATLAALWHRENSGEGQYVDVAISEYIATILENALSMYSYTGASVGRSGNRGYGRAAWGPYRAKDGYVGVIAGPDRKWESMVDLMEIPGLADSRFKDRSGRITYADEIDNLMKPWLIKRGKKEIFEKAQGLGLAFAYVATPQDILEWEHLGEREFFVKVQHPVAGDFQYSSGPYKISEFPWQLDPAPTLGQHNQAILCDLLGYSTADLLRMKDEGVI